jgi:group I intron endonuclease
MLIYLAKNRVNGKVYIGKTVNSLSDRKARHLYAVRKNREIVYFHNAIKKYGEKAFSWEVLYIAKTSKDLSLMEEFYICVYKANDRRYGYNRTNGGEGCEGYKHTDNTRALLSAGKKGKVVGPDNPMYGRHHSDETRKLQSESKSGANNPFWGKKRPDHAAKMRGRKNISAARKGVDNPNYGKKRPESVLIKMRGNKAFLGRKHSQETKDKMSRAALGRTPSLETRDKLRKAAMERGRIKRAEVCAVMSQIFVTPPICIVGGSVRKYVRTC